MRTTWEKLCQYIGKKMSEDIATELHNKTKVMITEPTHLAEVEACHATQAQMIIASRQNLRNALVAKLASLEAAGTSNPVDITQLQNDLVQSDFQALQPVPYDLTADKKTQWDAEWKTYQQRKDQLVKNCGQAYSLVLGQCTQLLQDQMKQDVDWTNVSTSNNPL